MDIVAFAKENWAVIEQAPWAFVISATLFLAIGYAVAAGLTSERLQLAEARVADYKEKLEGKSPDEAGKLIASLEKRLAAVEPLSLTEQQERTMGEVLSGNPAGIMISHDAASGQYKKLHGQLARIFSLAGWDVRTPMVMGVGNPPPSGIAIISHGRDVPEGRAIMRAFSAAGIKYDAQSMPDIAISEMPALEILVTTPYA